MEQAFTELLKHSLAGVGLVLLALVVVALWKAFTAAQEARIEDKRSNTDNGLELARVIVSSRRPGRTDAC